jgi:hypothetical protein
VSDPGDEVEVDTDDELDDDFDPNRKPAATATAVLEYLVRAVVDEPDGVEVKVDDDRVGKVQSERVRRPRRHGSRHRSSRTGRQRHPHGRAGRSRARRHRRRRRVRRLIQP